MKIRTEDHGGMAVPFSFMRWTAVDDDTYEAGAPIGFGATEAEAIRNLEEQHAPEEGDLTNWPETINWQERLDELYKVESE